MNFSKRFKSLPVSTKKLLGLGVVLAMIVALPLFIWAVITQNFNPFKRAASGEPGVCVADNKVITVTPLSDINGTCHDIQMAIDAATGDGYTVKIEPGVYDVSSQININGKSNLSIVGNGSGDAGAVVIHRSDGFGILVENSSGSIMWITLSGGSSNGMLSIHNSNNFSVYNSFINSQTSHTLDIQGSSNINISQTDIQSSAGALEIDTSNNIYLSSNRIHNSDNAIRVSSSSNVTINHNVVHSNRESGLVVNASVGNIQDLDVFHNTFANNGIGNQAPTIKIIGVNGTNIGFNNNIVFGGAGPGMYTQDGLGFGPHAYNDIFANNPDYSNYASQTGINGNISQDPKLDVLSQNPPSYCLMSGSPAIYGDYQNGQYMGAVWPCGTYPTPQPTPYVTPTPSSNSCGGTCGSNLNCTPGLYCNQGFCRNPSCGSDTDCNCDVTKSCSSVTVTGATYGGGSYGQELYYLPSGGSATLHANTTPSNLPVNWTIQSFSSLLPNSGSFSTNFSADTIYTAPINPNSTDQGVEIRGDISEYPNQWLYCPKFTIAIKPESAVGARSFEIFFKFDGVTDNSAEEQGAKVNVRFASRSLDPAGLETGQRPVSYIDNGVYKLLIDIEPGTLPAADDYSITIKGEKHLHVRFCENGQTTHCSINQSGRIILPVNQIDTMMLNFIGIPLPAGDTPVQDGGVDTNDYNLIKTLTAKISTSLSPTDKLMGDLNYDGKIDTRDLFLIRKTLETRYD